LRLYDALTAGFLRTEWASDSRLQIKARSTGI
jgi:hypothetical protein